VFISLGLFFQTTELLSGRGTLSRSARFGVAAMPAIAIFVLTGALLFFGLGSFTGPLNLVGALTLPLLGGVFPMLLIAAARRRGERVPGTPLRWLASWPVVASVTALYLGGVLAHALVIWSDPVERLLALGVALGMAWLIVAAFRRRSFAPRVVVELLADEPPGAGMTISVVSAGHPVSDRRLDEVAGVGPVAIPLPADRPEELYVWAHRPTRDGDTAPLDIAADVAGDPASPELTVRLPGAT
jgi:hypothetical protein